jgi:hypothetical protein
MITKPALLELRAAQHGTVPVSDDSLKEQLGDLLLGQLGTEEPVDLEPFAAEVVEDVRSAVAARVVRKQCRSSNFRLGATKTLLKKEPRYLDSTAKTFAEH